MAKDYKLMYTKLKKTLKDELAMIRKYQKPINSSYDAELWDKVENYGVICHLNWLFEEYLPELEGKKWGNVTFNREEYKKWKKKVGK
jgi:hypothetical protein